jgi:hypothetical protein
MRNLHKFGVSHGLTQMITIKLRVREGEEHTHIKAQCNNTHKKAKETSAKTLCY